MPSYGRLVNHRRFVFGNFRQLLHHGIFEVPAFASHIVGARSVNDAGQFAVGVEFKHAPRTGFRPALAVYQTPYVHKTRRLRFARRVSHHVSQPDAGIVPIGRHGAVHGFKLHLIAQLVGRRRHEFPESVGRKRQHDAGHRKHPRQFQRGQARNTQNRKFAVGRPTRERIDRPHQRRHRHHFINAGGKIQRRHRYRLQKTVARADVAQLTHQIKEGEQRRQGKKNEQRRHQHFPREVPGHNLHHFARSFRASRSR